MGWRRPLGVIRGSYGYERTIRAQLQGAMLSNVLVRRECARQVAARIAETLKAEGKAREAEAKLLELSPFLVRVRELSERMRNEVYGCQISFDPRAFSMAYFERPGFRSCDYLTHTVADLCAKKVRNCMRQWQVEHGMGRSY